MSESIPIEKLDWMAATAKLVADQKSASIWQTDVAQALAELLSIRRSQANPRADDK